MFERTKCLAHVAKFPKRRVQLFGLGLSCRGMLRGTTATALEIQDDEQKGDGK